MNGHTAAYLPRVPSPPAEDPELTSMRSDVARRLAHVCAELAPHDFAALVDRIARFNRRWQLREPPAADAAPARTTNGAGTG